jgi:YD repeat-containing protein
MGTFKAPTLGPFGWLRDKHLPPNLRDGNIQTFLADEAADPASPLAGELSATYASAFADTGITYNPDGTVATVTEGGITTSYTYNPDGTVATDTRLGITRTYTYTDGNLTGIEAA